MEIAKCKNIFHQNSIYQLLVEKYNTPMLKGVFLVLVNSSLRTLFFTIIAVSEITAFRSNASAVIMGVFLVVTSVLAAVAAGVTWCIRRPAPCMHILFFYRGCHMDLPIMSMRSEWWWLAVTSCMMPLTGAGHGGLDLATTWDRMRCMGSQHIGSWSPICAGTWSVRMLMVPLVRLLWNDGLRISRIP